MIKTAGLPVRLFDSECDLINYQFFHKTNVIIASRRRPLENEAVYRRGIKARNVFERKNDIFYEAIFKIISAFRNKI